MKIQAQSLNDQLMIGLARARSSWENRMYALSQYLSVNENRRKHEIELIDSLITFYKERGFLTPKQQEKARQIIENANKKGG